MKQRPGGSCKEILQFLDGRVTAARSGPTYKALSGGTVMNRELSPGRLPFSRPVAAGALQGRAISLPPLV